MAANTQNINAKSVAKYLLLPGIIPRAKEFTGSGFGYIAFLFARIYAAVRILPVGHPFLNYDNIGRFSVLQVIGAAAANLQFNKRNIDQLIVFVALLAGVVLMFMQFLLLILAIFSADAHAQVTFTGMFTTEFPETDIAFLLLDYVFGIGAIGGGAAGASFFGSNALVATGGATPFQLGMQALFQFYNLAILLVGAIIFMYYVAVVVIETAQTGVPFGRRFSKIYAPLRFVLAIGLLIPLSQGFNTAQYITLMAAKMGSSFATNGWLLYNQNLTGLNPMGIENASLVARPRQPYLDDLLYFSSVYHTCRYMYWATVTNRRTNGRTCIGAYVIVDGEAQVLGGLTGEGCAAGAGTFDYNAAKNSLSANGDVWGTGDVEVVLGELDAELWPDANGGVQPFCGKLTIPLGHLNPSYYTGDRMSGVAGVEAAYFGLVGMVLNPEGGGAIGTTESDDFNLFKQLGERSAQVTITQEPYHNPCVHAQANMNEEQLVAFVQSIENFFAGIGVPMPGWSQLVAQYSGLMGGLNDEATCGRGDWAPPSSVFQGALDGYKVQLDEAITTAHTTLVGSMNLNLTQEQANRGWGGAGIWYNQIADLNGVFTGAVYATPSVRAYPKIMNDVKDKRQEQDQTADYCKTFDPNLADNQSVDLTNFELTMATAMNQTFQYFCDRPNAETGNAADAALAPSAAGTNSSGCSLAPLQQGGATKGSSSNVFIDVVSLIFGLNGLFDLKTCSQAGANGMPLVHPLAQLSAIGKSLIENAIRSMGMALGASFGGGILSVLAPALGGALQALSGMFVGIATIGLTIGFILYYILPFLPFIYFFFAVGAWVKSIFEAMVGVPLWALAHLHIDGDGLPGKAAMPGYWLIFEIFLRPIVTVFGLIGGMACFGALTIALNNLFDLVVSNSTGAAPGASQTELTVDEIAAVRAGTIDQFFYTVMYAILVYMMATASFKMIDTIPKAFMRWINTGITTFNDNKGDPTSDLTTYAAVGGARASSQVFGGMQSFAQGAGQTGGALIKASQSREGGT